MPRLPRNADRDWELINAARAVVLNGTLRYEHAGPHGFGTGHLTVGRTLVAR